LLNCRDSLLIDVVRTKTGNVTFLAKYFQEFLEFPLLSDFNFSTKAFEFISQPTFQIQKIGCTVVISICRILTVVDYRVQYTFNLKVKGIFFIE